MAMIIIKGYKLFSAFFPVYPSPCHLFFAWFTMNSLQGEMEKVKLIHTSKRHGNALKNTIQNEKGSRLVW